MNGWLRGLPPRACKPIILSGHNMPKLMELYFNKKLRTMHGVGPSIEKDIIEWLRNGR